MTEVGDGPAPLPAMVPVEMASQVVEITAGADFDRLIEQYTEAEDFHSPILAMARKTCVEKLPPLQTKPAGTIIEDSSRYGQPGEQKLSLRRCFFRSLYVLRKRLSLLSDRDWVAWLRSQYFLPMWMMLWRTWLQYHCTEMIDPLRNEAFQLCITKYQSYISKSAVLGPESSGAEHLARFLTLLVYHNFGSQTLPVLARNPEPLYFMWAVMLVVKLAHAPWHHDSPRGAKALFTQEYEDLFKKPRQ